MQSPWLKLYSPELYNGQHLDTSLVRSKIHYMNSPLLAVSVMMVTLQVLMNLALVGSTKHLTYCTQNLGSLTSSWRTDLTANKSMPLGFFCLK